MTASTRPCRPARSASRYASRAVVYRSAPSVVDCLTARLGPLGFDPVAPDDSLRARGVVALFRRKTWNTNRGVVVAEPCSPDLRASVEELRGRAGAFLGSSWWSQLGLQIVFLFDGPPPNEDALGGLVDRVNTQGVLVQSVFALDRATGQSRSARTWGQVVTGRFQDAIRDALDALRVAHAQ